MSFNVSSVEALQKSFTKNIACSAAALAAGEACHALNLGDTAASLAAMLASAATSNHLNERWRAEESKAGDTEKPSSKATNTRFGNFFGEFEPSGINVGGEVSYSHGTHTTTAPLIDLDMKNLQKSWKTLREVAHLDIGKSLTIIAEEATTPEIRQAIENAQKVDEALIEDGASIEEREKALQDKKLAAARQVSVVIKDAVQEVINDRSVKKTNKKRVTRSKEKSSKGIMGRNEPPHHTSQEPLSFSSLSPEEADLVTKMVVARLSNFNVMSIDGTTSQPIWEQHPDLKKGITPSALRNLATSIEDLKKQYPEESRNVELCINAVCMAADILSDAAAYWVGYIGGGEKKGNETVSALREIKSIMEQSFVCGFENFAEWYGSLGESPADTQDRIKAVYDVGGHTMPYLAVMPMVGNLKNVGRGIKNVRKGFFNECTPSPVNLNYTISGYPNPQRIVLGGVNPRSLTGVSNGEKLARLLNTPIDTKIKLLPSTKMADHHIFPQQFKKFFEEKGINIHEHTISVGEITHLKGIHGSGNAGMPGRWNQRWGNYINSNPNASSKDIYQFAGSLLDEYNLNNINIHRYKK